MCLSKVMTKEEFIKEYGKIPKYGYKIVCPLSGTDKYYSLYQGNCNNMAIGKTLYEEDFRNIGSSDYYFDNSIRSYRLGFHVYTNFEECKENLNNFYDTVIIKVKPEKIVAYGCERVSDWYEETPVVICKTMTIVKEVDVLK